MPPGISMGGISSAKTGPVQLRAKTPARHRARMRLLHFLIDCYLHSFGLQYRQYRFGQYHFNPDTFAAQGTGFDLRAFF